MNPVKRSILVLAITAGPFTLSAQRGKPLPATQKFKPPVVKTMLGTYADSAWVSVTDALQLINTPIRVADGKMTYSLVTYQFAYKQLVVSEDEQSGKAIDATDVLAERFKTTPIPQSWQERIRESLHKGEMLYFFDVTVKDQQGRLFFAPEFKIHIK